jgi:hypothetical protein
MVLSLEKEEKQKQKVGKRVGAKETRKGTLSRDLWLLSRIYGLLWLTALEVQVHN